MGTYSTHVVVYVDATTNIPVRKIAERACRHIHPMALVCMTADGEMHESLGYEIGDVYYGFCRQIADDHKYGLHDRYSRSKELKYYAIDIPSEPP